MITHLLTTGPNLACGKEIENGFCYTCGCIGVTCEACKLTPDYKDEVYRHEKLLLM